MKFKEIDEKLQAKRAELKQFMDSLKGADGQFGATTVEQRTEIRKRNEELNELGKAWEEARELELLLHEANAKRDE